jgi:hypothetical protein
MVLAGGANTAIAAKQNCNANHASCIANCNGLPDDKETGGPKFRCLFKKSPRTRRSATGNCSIRSAQGLPDTAIDECAGREVTSLPGRCAQCRASRQK